MESLANLESFVQSAQLSSFSAAARRLALTPAAVSRNVATLERGLGVRLFQRSTRRVSLTEAGEKLLSNVGDPLQLLQKAMSDASVTSEEPRGILKLSMSPSLGMNYIVPLLPDFLALYPSIRLDWHFDSRQVDLVAEGFDAAIGGGFDLASGIVARTLAPAHIIAVAAPSYIAGRAAIEHPRDLVGHSGIVMRSVTNGRIRNWTVTNAHGEEQAVRLQETLIFNDSAPMAQAAIAGLGIAMLAVPDVLAPIERGELIRLLPGWHTDLGNISLYYPHRNLQPRKTAVFIDFLGKHFRRNRLSERFSAAAPAGRPRKSTRRG
jgi:DNA-binding transcriptional LysR family regulator